MLRLSQSPVLTSRPVVWKTAAEVLLKKKNEIMNTVRTETLCSSYIELASENRKASVRIKGTIKIADCIQFVSIRLV